jgi:hypothetical protein
MDNEERIIQLLESIDASLKQSLQEQREMDKEQMKLMHSVFSDEEEENTSAEPWANQALVQAARERFGAPSKF